MSFSKLRLIHAPNSGRISTRSSCMAGNANVSANANVSHGQNVRNASTKGPGINKPPEINFDPAQGNTILNQKAKRAAELHAELNQLLDKQAKRRADEMTRPFGSGFIDFMKKSKSEMINIFASFFCVCLAYQIYGIRKGARKLIEQAEENNKKIDEYKDKLRFISSGEFQSNVSKICASEMKTRSDTHKEKNNGRGLGWFGRNAMDNNLKKDPATEEILSSILQMELGKVIGDLALTDSEIQEKKLAELQKGMGIMQDSRASPDTLGGLEQIMVGRQDDDGSSTKKVLKRTGFI